MTDGDDINNIATNSHHHLSVEEHDDERRVAFSNAESLSKLMVNDDGFMFGSEFENKEELEEILAEFFGQSKEDVASLSIGSLGTHAIMSGVSSIVQDEFSKCFQKKSYKPWNWNFYLFPAWFFGCFIRFGILFPLRAFFLISATFFVLLCLPIIRLVYRKDKQLCLKKEGALMSLYAQTWVASWSGVVKYHGHAPKYQAHQIYVANHTSMIDFIILLAVHPFAVVGQLHQGFVNFFQTNILQSLGCVWFNRSEAKDRDMVRNKIKEHCADGSKPPLLIFPEGTCVNTKYSVMFKRGAFELDAVVYPVAMKYNTVFVDAFWDSKSQSFFEHIITLMTAWALICDVYFLDPVTRKENESPEQFANRVKELISKTADLISVPWDGYYKHIVATEKLRTKQREKMADQVKKILRRKKFSTNSKSFLLNALYSYQNMDVLTEKEHLKIRNGLRPSSSSNTLKKNEQKKTL